MDDEFRYVSIHQWRVISFKAGFDMPQCYYFRLIVVEIATFTKTPRHYATVAS